MRCRFVGFKTFNHHPPGAYAPGFILTLRGLETKLSKHAPSLTFSLKAVDPWRQIYIFCSSGDGFQSY
jgi:hypothetical protein